METKVQVEMTAEQAEAFKQFQEKQAKEEAAKSARKTVRLTLSWLTARWKLLFQSFAVCRNKCLR